MTEFIDKIPPPDRLYKRVADRIKTSTGIDVFASNIKLRVDADNQGKLAGFDIGQVLTANQISDILAEFPKMEEKVWLSIGN